MGPGPSLLTTALGPLDVLGAIEGGRTFEDLVPHALEIIVSGNPIAVLGLPALVALKKGSTHPNDRYTLLILEETLRRAGG
jgi:hypothetical protein